MIRLAIATVAAMLLALGPRTPFAAPDYPGPYSAEVLAVTDGDTLRVRVRLWPNGLVAEEPVRLAGLDAPELRGQCESERAAARRARARLAELAGIRVVLRAVSRDKYGRLLARVETPDGRDLAARLIAEGLARAYAGGARAGWC